MGSAKVSVRSGVGYWLWGILRFAKICFFGGQRGDGSDRDGQVSGEVRVGRDKRVAPGYRAARLWG